MPRVAAHAREAGVLGQEAVARVDRVGADADGEIDDVLGLEVARARGRRIADQVRLVGELHRELGAIDGRVHHRGANARDRAEPRITRTAISPRLTTRTLRSFRLTVIEGRPSTRVSRWIL